MKDKYEAIDLEIIEFEVEDVITTSNTGEGGNDDSGIGA